MAGKTMEIKLYKQEGSATEQQFGPVESQKASTPDIANTPVGVESGNEIADVSASNSGVSSKALALAALALAKMIYKRINSIELQNRENIEAMRNYGGAGFSSNSLGDRYDVFGHRNAGESVAYKK